MLQQLAPGAIIAIVLRQASAAIKSWLLPEYDDQSDVSIAPVDIDSPSYLVVVNGYVEMYGGAGVGANAGGVRCANVGNVQIKGIGRTNLAGNTTDKWHRHGALSL